MPSATYEMIKCKRQLPMYEEATVDAHRKLQGERYELLDQRLYESYSALRFCSRCPFSASPVPRR